MRIVYLAKMFPRVSETFIANEISELKRRGLEVHVVSLLPTTVGRLWPEVESTAAETYDLPDPLTNASAVLASQWGHFRTRPLRYLGAFGRVAQRFSRRSWKRFFQAGLLLDFCERHEVKHIHAAFAHTPASVAIWVRRLGGVSYSMSAHAKDLYLSDPASIRRKMDEARFVWTCTAANGVFLRNLGSHTPIEVGYHGVDLARFRPTAGVGSKQGRARNPSTPRFRILSLCRLVPKKGLTHLLEAAALLRERGDSEFEIHLGGSGPERDRLESEVDRLGLAGHVRFLGTLLSEKVTKAYGEADVFVLPSVVLENGDRDGVPNVLVEAMASGVPVVSTRVSGIPELIEDGVSGLLVEARDTTALADALENVMKDPKAAAERAEAGKATVAERFDLRSNSERLAERIRQVRRANRALYVSTDLGIPIRGHKGASAHVRQIAEQMVARGIGIRVLSPEPGPLPPEGNQFAVPIVTITPSGRMAKWMKQYPKGSWRRDVLKEARRIFFNVSVWRELSSEPKPDFIYERYALCSFATGVYCRRRSIPWILEVNAPLADEEAEFRGLRWRWLTHVIERWCLRKADQVFVVSGALRNWAMEEGTHPDRVATLANGVDRERFHPQIDGRFHREELGFGPDDIVVTFSGSLKPWHGGDVLLDAFEQVQKSDPRVRLLYVGDGPERKPLQKRCRKHGIEGVVFTGAVPHDRVPEFLAASDVLVAPYLPHDKFYFSPLKVLEYLAAGRPVLASDVGEIGEWVDSSAGRLVKAGSAKQLGVAISELAGDRELRDDLARGARKRTRKDDWSERAATIARRVEELRGARAIKPLDRVGYILKMFPRFSETFVIREVLEIERQGVEVRTFSMKVPHGPRQAEAAQVRARQRVLSDPKGWPSWRLLLVQMRCFFHWPTGYFQAFRFATTRGDMKAVEKLLHAGEIALVCRRERISHLHAHFASGPTRVAKLTSMISGVPFSFTAHAKDLYWRGHNHGTGKKLKKRVRQARFVAVISEENKRFIEEQGFVVKPGRVRPIYIGVRPDDYRFTLPSERPTSPLPLVLAVGRLIEKKGFDVLLESAAVLQTRGVRFRVAIAGEGPLEGELRTQIVRLGLERVHLLGAVPLQRLRERYYSRAAVLAQPCVVAADGDQDGIPTVLIEAMALGVPVISTNVSGIPEAITDRENGFVTEPGDISLLADRIEALLQDRALADRLARAGRARVERQFNLERNVGALLKLFRRSMAGWPARKEWLEIQKFWVENERTVESPTPRQSSDREPVSSPAAREFPESSEASVGRGDARLLCSDPSGLAVIRPTSRSAEAARAALQPGTET